MRSWDDVHDAGRAEEVGLLTIGAGIRERRLVLGLSQRQLAWRARVSQSTISRLETGRLRTIRLVTLARLVGVLRMSPSFLFPGEPPTPSRHLPGRRVA